MCTPQAAGSTTTCDQAIKPSLDRSWLSLSNYRIGKPVYVSGLAENPMEENVTRISGNLAQIALGFALLLTPVGVRSAQAAPTAMTVEMDAKDEVPPNDSAGKATAQLTYDKDSKVLTWSITYSGLTGPATAAHFHGPAAAGANAGVALPIGVAPSPIVGKATLTDAQASDMLAGKWYMNMHTDAHKGGEIRGQVIPPK
jgi:hypothetical protein